MTNIAGLDQQRFVQNKNYIASDMNGEKVMLDVQSGKYYNLGTIGGRIWDLSAQASTVDEIVARLLEEYEVSQEVCKQQVTTFMGQMLSEGLVDIDDQGTSSR
ncbi:lasso peptide biosynthesis PqqD family chaperone [Paenibacillus hunanensis]|uniref:lasso peptide biosynthesis PqqD family chaperone n=1 Tax=Paenibacillus hunanensis TaxID=539262 RepID=UPI002A6B5533|nr:lasso peptide biosynthesis PqqD family chaperone [Paenibacillus hunanensis]WPP40623.1 lasso peptide biosynthesis PqqD family chaperone [Paenibacillus hunanensis]